MYVIRHFRSYYRVRTQPTFTSSTLPTNKLPSLRSNFSIISHAFLSITDNLQTTIRQRTSSSLPPCLCRGATLTLDIQTDYLLFLISLELSRSPSSVSPSSSLVRSSTGNRTVVVNKDRQTYPRNFSFCFDNEDRCFSSSCICCLCGCLHWIVIRPIIGSFHCCRPRNCRKCLVFSRQ